MQVAIALAKTQWPELTYVLLGIDSVKQEIVDLLVGSNPKTGELLA